MVIKSTVVSAFLIITSQSYGISTGSLESVTSDIGLGSLESDVFLKTNVLSLEQTMLLAVKECEQTGVKIIHSINGSTTGPPALIE